MNVKIKKLHENAVIPKYQTEGASGFDFHAVEDVTLHPGVTLLVKTGLAFEVPKGYELQVCARSGLSLKTPLRLANSVGRVDSDFRGEVCVIMENLSDNASYQIKKGDRIAQGIIAPVVQAKFEVVDQLDVTNRGAGGFGSTGT